MKKKDQEQWTSVIAAQENSGKSIKRWCRENDITESQFSYWKKKIKTESSNANEGRFLLVGEAKGLEIVIGGRITIVVSRGFDRDLLREVRKCPFPPILANKRKKGIGRARRAICWVASYVAGVLRFARLDDLATCEAHQTDTL